MDYRRTTLFDLVRVLNYRLSIGDSCLLCIDNCSNLTPNRLKYFAQFLQDFDKPIGLVFRISAGYAKKISQDKRYSDAYQHLIKVVDNWRVLDRCTEDEVEMVARLHVEDPMLLSDLVQSSKGNLTVLQKNIGRLRAFRSKVSY